MDFFIYISDWIARGIPIVDKEFLQTPNSFLLSFSLFPSSIAHNPLLIILPLIFIAGFIDAIAGGGGLISLPAYLVAGLPPHIALANNKFSS